VTDYYRSSEETVTLTENRRTDNYLFSHEYVEVADWWSAERITFNLGSNDVVTLTETYQVLPQVTGSIARSWRVDPLDELTYQRVGPLASWEIVVEDWIHGAVGEGTVTIGNPESQLSVVEVTRKTQFSDALLVTPLIQEELRDSSIDFKITSGLAKSRTTHTIKITNKDPRYARLLYVLITGWRSLATNVPVER